MIDRDFYCKFFECGGGDEGKIKAHIIRNVNFGNGLYFFTLDKVSEQTGVTISKVKKVFDGLMDKDIIRKYQHCVWMVHPLIFNQNKTERCMKQIMFYNSLSTRERQ